MKNINHHKIIDIMLMILFPRIGVKYLYQRERSIPQKTFPLPLARAIALLVSLLFSYLTVTPAFGQEPVGLEEVKPLKTGDAIPEALWSLPLQVVNHPEGKEVISLSDYRDRKLIILDFWATWCGTCIASMPRIHALQDSFNKDMIVLPITGQSASTAGKFIAHNAYLSTLRLNSIVEDTIISKLFPHTMIPHVIWIVDGRVYAISNSIDISKENIISALNQIPSRIPLKADVMNYNSERPLLLAGNGAREDYYLSRTIITNRIDGIPSNLKFLSKNESLGSFIISGTNISLRNMYTLAFKNLRRLPLNRILLDPLLKNSDFEQKFFKELYCYEWSGLLPALLSAETKIQTDINIFFGLNVSLENRFVKCLVIQKINNDFKYSAPQLQTEYLSAWVKRFNKIPSNIPLIDESENKMLTVSVMSANFADIDEVNLQLAGQGYHIVETERNLDVLVVSSLKN